MPDRSRHATRIPPTLWDHLLSHPGELAAATWWTVLGVALAISHMVDDMAVSTAIESLPPHLTIGLAVALGGGGAMTIAGILWPGQRLTTAWAVERSGLILAGGGWAAYGTSLAWYGWPVMATTVSITMLLLIVLRLIALHGVEQATRRMMRQAGAES